MRLAELEAAVHAHVLAGGELPAALVEAVAPPAEERWQIYTDGYRLRLAESLGLQYPALLTRLGTAPFAALAEAFIVATPSVHRSIRDYGRELGAFIRAHSSAIDAALLVELADFEWLLAGAFDAADATPTTAADLASLAPTEWAGLAFRAVPSLRRLTTFTPAVAAWRAVQAGSPVDEGSPVPAAAEPVAVAAERTEWLIWRRGLATEFRPTTAEEAAALDRLTGGATFGALCEELFESHGERAALRAAAWLKGWLLEGLLLRV